MPTTKHRVNLTVDEETMERLKKMQKKTGFQLATLCIWLIRNQLEAQDFLAEAMFEATKK